MTREDGFDCSGFVTYVLKMAGLHVPDYIGQDNVRREIRHANEYWDHYGVQVDDPLKQPGDLIFFSRKGSLPTHVGIVFDDDTFIHSPGTEDGQVALKSISYEAIAARGIGRILHTHNPIGYKSPVTTVDDISYRYHHKPID